MSDLTAIKHRWGKKSAVDLFEVQMQTIMDALKKLEAAGGKIDAGVMRFIRMANGRPWDAIPNNRKWSLYDLINEELSAVSKASGSIVDAASGRMIQNLNILGDKLGVGGFPGMFNEYQNALAYAKEYTIRAVAVETQRAALSINGIVQAATEANDFTGMRAAIRGALGTGKTLTDAMKEALKSDKSPLLRWQDIREAFTDAEGSPNVLAWRVTMIERTEATNQQVAAQDAWMESLGDIVIGEEFVPEGDACDVCTGLAGQYERGECPTPVDDTHPNCNCSKQPIFEGEVEKDQLKGAA